MNRTTYTTGGIRKLIRHTYRGVALTLVVLMVASPLSLGVAPKKAEAQFEGIGSVLGACAAQQLLGWVGNMVGNWLGGGAGAISGMSSVPVRETNQALIQDSKKIAAGTSNLTMKECVLDGMVWMLKNVVIQQLTQDILTWIEGGFDGSPAFISNPEEWLDRVNEEVTFYAITRAGLWDLVCEPFRISVQLAMLADYSTRRGGGRMCDMDEVLGGSSFDVFVKSGQFNAGPGGGFSSMFKVINKNNPIDTYMNASDEIALRAQQKINSERSLLAYGNGYLSMRCDTDNDGAPDSVCTPGTFVANQVDDWTGGQLAQLEAADEFAEIVNALLAALVKKIFEDDEGLRGAGRDSGYWSSAANGTRNQDICSEVPAGWEEICDDTPATPIGPPAGDPPLVDPAQTAQWNALRTCLNSVVTTMIMIVSGWGDGRLFQKVALLPQLNTLLADLGAVDTTQPGAGATLASIQTRIEALSDDTGVPVSCGGGTNPGVPPPPAPPPPDPGTLPPLPILDPPPLGGGIPLPPGPGPIP